MLWADVVALLVFYGQPPIIGLILVLAMRRGLSLSPYFNWVSGARRHRKGARFFECGVRPRLQAQFSYEVPLLTFCALFVLYDADLIFFLPEATACELWTPLQPYVVGFCAVVFFGSM